MNVPTILTLSRIVMIPIFLVVFYLPFPWVNTFCTVLFVLAAVTDWLDGYLARKYNLTSHFGAFLDPVADKLMVSMVLVLIVDRNPTPYGDFWMAIPAVIIIGRELAISALREWMAKVGEQSRVSVSYIGKVKTAAQLVALPMLIYAKPLFDTVPVALIGFYLLYAAALLTFWSMFVYLRAAWPTLKDSAANTDIGD